MSRPSHLVEYILFSIFRGALFLLPFPVAPKAGGALGRIFYSLMPGRRAITLPGVPGEGGFLLVLVMVVLLVVSTIAGATLINSFLERSLAKNPNYASVALQAADGGLAAGITWLRENQAALYNPSKDADFYTNAVKHGWTQQLTRTLPSGGKYTVTMRFKRRWFDYNEDTDCQDPGEMSEYSDATAGNPTSDCGLQYTYTDLGGVTHNVRGSSVVILYNHCAAPAVGCFGFPEDKYLLANEGYPVVEIDSVGTFGQGSYRQIALDIARDKFVVPGVGGDHLEERRGLRGERLAAEGRALPRAERRALRRFPGGAGPPVRGRREQGRALRGEQHRRRRGRHHGGHVPGLRGADGARQCRHDLPRQHDRCQPHRRPSCY